MSNREAAEGMRTRRLLSEALRGKKGALTTEQLGLPLGGAVDELADRLACREADHLAVGSMARRTYFSISGR